MCEAMGLVYMTADGWADVSAGIKSVEKLQLYIYIYLSRNRPIYGTIPIQTVQADNIENVHTYIYIYNLLLLYTSWKSKIV